LTHKVDRSAEDRLQRATEPGRSLNDLMDAHGLRNPRMPSVGNPSGLLARHRVGTARILTAAAFCEIIE
jgi:hypothetical protein